jgi:hypothetical protein
MKQKKNIHKNSTESPRDLMNQEIRINELSLIPNEEQSSVTENNSIQNNMEVHHHPDLHHNPKKWKEYLLEFLMIFLAVCMGFIAENFRESQVNKEKERNYIENLVRDLKGQKKDITEAIKVNEQRIIALDTLVRIRALDFSKKSNYYLFYKLFDNAKMYSLGIFKVNEITLTQIKSTGGMNIIRPKIANLIAELDMNNQNIKWVEQFPDRHGEETMRMIYEFTDYPAIWDKDGNLNTDLPPLIIDDKKKLMKFFNLSVDLKYTIIGYNDNLKVHLTLINKLIKVFEDEYDLHE